MRIADEFRGVVRFGFVGIAATLVHSLVYLALVSLTPIAPWLANLFAYLTALLVSLVGHTRVTFGIVLDLAHAQKITLASLVSLALNAFFVWLVGWLSYPAELAVVFFVTATPAATYLLLRLLLVRG